MLESLFGNPVIEKILFYLLVHQSCYPSQLKERFQMPLYSLQRAFMRLEKGGIVVRHSQGKTVVYQLNPLYPFLEELETFLRKAYESFPREFRTKYYEPIIRTRPRRQGKPL